ncbi:dihydroxyacetone kinase subunit DhaK [Halalkalibacterium halodurans]|uniref:phosphoenolpyruvate--glycerone phosphotransferase n=1 Tax=Halalkalibacterium halodurans TaxID=86665 RepID=A0A0M0KGA6_ALKHA|nr:dihydroxyacetone kinase subunit DhaK [Halalkalibacterium halodurans]MDY7223931.1 dihydroxyacetone kinase subunit DhaK [Halalkalibacterium halodurans]MDY7243152.1 dihydroxyacetone kinase subunit DhaK [Halalkalibacterium halodurans]MED3647868.1 dihydroxyacetone kinase subunit DhaK [Halalkalibacterium halodurans]MED4162797.1 dihydroxyacetone kinase subunit DhaK [Halalkalibacterium halodurans]TES51828.1 dihydroxyacetone kinase subunit DhaK [Halalkalibacterium halodurans]
MKKILNDPQNVLDEMLDGFVYANGHLVERVAETGVIRRTYVDKGKVALVSGGGSGHEPSHAGFVGQGMLAAAVCGEVFTSPTPDQIFEGIKAADQGGGVLLIIKNYTGDVMNFEMAGEMAEAEGITVDHIIVNDDIAVEDSSFTAGRRGVAGTIIVHKIVGAAAEAGLSLQSLKVLGETVIENTKTIGVSILPATVPAVGKPGFELGDDEMEYGVGIHGEPGYRKEKLKSSKEIAEELILKLKEAFGWSKGDKYGVLVNGLGATPLMEQYVFMNDVANKLTEEGLNIQFKKVGSFMTSIDMAGVSLTLIKIVEEKWLDYWNHEVKTVDWA